VANESAGVRIERGTAVAGLLTGRPVDGVPRVVGVRTETGTDLAADLVVDTTGRRSPLPSWLEAIGAPAPMEEREDSGFVYYGRHFRSTDGTLPPSFGPNLQHYESISFLTLPADNGTWGVGIVTSAADTDLRVLRHVDRWEAVIGAYPLLAHWAQGEPLDDGVAVMAKIEDRRREFSLDGQPLATGVVAVGDSWACTNPSVGRGASLAALHALGLRDHLRTTPTDDPLAFARGWIDVTEATVAPFYRETLNFDRHRLAEIDAEIRGEPYEPGDPTWEATKALGVGSSKDPDLLRGALAIGLVLRTAADVFADPAFGAKVDANGGNWRDERAPGPARSELLAITGA